MGHTKYKAGSKTGNKLAKRGRSLNARPPGSASDTSTDDEIEMLVRCPFKDNDAVQVTDGDEQGTEGVVKWRGVQRGAVVLGIADSERRRKGLVFAKADDCALLD